MCIPAVFTYCLMEEVADYGFCYNFGGGDSYSVFVALIRSMDNCVG